MQFPWMTIPQNNIIHIQCSCGTNLTPYGDVHTLSHMSLADFAACVVDHHMPTKREASCLQQQSVSALDTHTSCHPKVLISSAAHYSTKPFYGHLYLHILQLRSNQHGDTFTYKTGTSLHVCISVCVSSDVVACEPECDKIIKILLAVQEASNYKQAYFSTQLKLTN